MEAGGGGGGRPAPGSSPGLPAAASGPPGPEPRKRRRKRSVPSINLTSCKYESVRRAALCCGLKEAGENEEWTVYWTDYSVSLERVMEMKRFQKINHFPGMIEICRKDLLARNLNRMLRLFPKEYNIFPRTWCLPADYGDFQAYRRARKNRTFICKPDSGCQGRGIFITHNPEEIKHGEHMICQQYISKPFLIDGFKFDMRIYVLVTSCDPLRIFVYKEGLARFATMRYIDPSSRNLVKKDDICMHLTNYAINKRNENFVQDDMTGSKRYCLVQVPQCPVHILQESCTWDTGLLPSFLGQTCYHRSALTISCPPHRKLSTLNAWMTDNSYNTTKLWEDIEDIIIKTLISAHPVVKHNYQSCFPNHTTGCACFEILGFDILVDRKLKPWLLEVNHSPSFTTDSPLDREVKDALLCDTINLINVHACNKRKVLEEDKQRAKERLLQAHQTLRASRREELESNQAAWLSQAEKYENSHLGGYRRIYPACGTEKYEPFFKQSGSLFQETVSSKAREECARQQLEEIRLKKEKLEAITRKKKTERKEDLHGESAGDKSQIRNKTTAPMTRLTYRSTRTWDRKLRRMQYDSMQPQDIVEDEEKKRVNALLQRENLIRGLGIIDQLSQLLPTTDRPADTQRSCTVIPKHQQQFLWEVPGGQETHCLTTRNSLSLLGGPVRSSGRQFIHNARANAKLPAGPGSDPAAKGTLSIRGQSIPYHKRGLRAQDTGWLRGQAARMAAVTQPCTKPKRLQAGGQWLPGTGNKAEGCSCHPGSPASTGNATADGTFTRVPQPARGMPQPMAPSAVLQSRSKPSPPPPTCSTRVPRTVLVPHTLAA
ncbi:tubulin polyglutamylase TTLL6 isoform X3 [Aquila chrysaetos chrysaetos]|uniref:tubulin polyglutamylase TTLL6 isoform X3 n=1 Tax=Aquila chrysaetos chrysaetos TaxID=223781 RepID=UPI0011772214|nr:tubulin polyglutamylase TTLL6 isoform X3 [Aquila chrysaetos chrysaetos]